MTTAEHVMNELKQLPEPLLREVLDFAHFLKSKADRAELDNLMRAQQTSMAHVWDNDEDEVWNNVPTR